MTAPVLSPEGPAVGSISSLIGDLEGRVDRVQISIQGPVATATEECTNDCTSSCVSCDTCFSCDSCTCSCIGCGDPPTTNPTPPTTTTTTTTFEPWEGGGWG